MTTMTTKPAWVTSDYVRYEDVVASWGLNVLHLDEHGSYQGDYTALLADGDRRGFLMFGYGSCSGCDALEACAPWGDDVDWSGVIALAKELHDQIKWFDSGDLLADFLVEEVRTEGKGTNWYWYDDEVKAAALRYAEELRSAT